MWRVRKALSAGQGSCASLGLGTVLLLGALSFGGTAEAQQTEDERMPDETTVLDPVKVTARKLEEPLRQVPFGITVFEADTIERESLRDARSFGRKVPGFNFVDTGLRGSNIPNIRGVGSFFPQSSDDASVPVFIDGVPVPVRAQDREFFDVERIEVLRGPQNTLYGRNAQAGAINVTTAAPSAEPTFELGGEVGNLESRRVRALASGPLGGKVAGRLAAQFDTRGGDIRDVNLDDDVRGQNLVNANGKLEWIPSDSSDVTLALRYGYYDEEPTQGAFFEDPGFPRLSLDTPLRLQTETLASGLTVRQDFEDVTLTTVTGLQYYTADFESDDTDGLVFAALTGLPPELFNDNDADFRELSDEDLQISQEIRLDGEAALGARWVAGLNFFRADLDFDLTFNSTGVLFGDFSNQFTTTSYAAFGEVTLPVTDEFRVIGGLRFTREVKEFDGRFEDRSGAAAVSTADENDSESFDLLTGRLALSYDFLPRLTGFASVSRGAKSGGFQLADTDVAQGFATSEFDEAYTWSYEAGLRGQLFDGRVDLSLSGFFNDTQDEHVQVFDFTTFQSVIENLDTQTYGVELEAAVRPLPGLTLSGGLAVLETEIKRSDDPTVEDGNEVPFAPSLAFDLALQYEHPVKALGQDGSVFGRVEYQYVGSRTVDPQNTFDLDSFDLVNLRLGWDAASLSVYGFVDNLLDKTYAETAFFFGNGATGGRVSLGIPGQPRRFGVGATVRF